jgi:hypothetical protein
MFVQVIYQQVPSPPPNHTHARTHARTQMAEELDELEYPAMVDTLEALEGHMAECAARSSPQAMAHAPPEDVAWALTVRPPGHTGAVLYLCVNNGDEQDVTACV